MIVNFFEESYIDSYNVEEKLKIIANSNTENANYISHVFKNAIEYLFEPVELNICGLKNGFPSNIEEVNAVIYFDTVMNEEELTPELITISEKTKLIIVGNHFYKRINSNIECINVKEHRKIKKHIKGYEKVYVGFNADNIDFSKYYYNKMKTYFLNVLDSLNEISIDELNTDTEKICSDILLNNENFKSKYIAPSSSIKFKDMMLVYLKILGLVKETTIDKDFMFYVSEKDIDDKTKNMLNELTRLIKFYNIQDVEEKISFAYDIICEMMLKEISKLNYCYFIDNACVTMRHTKGFPNAEENGCCNNTYKDKNKNCRYLNEDHSCSICSVSCRVFTCTYLQRRGIDHSLWQYPIIDCAFKKLARTDLIYSFFIPKEETITKMYHGLLK